jgi:hypothetical protein
MNENTHINTIVTKSNVSSLSIYINTYIGTGTDTVCPDAYIVSSTGLGFNFHSDYSVTYQGFHLSVSVVGSIPGLSAATSGIDI